MADEAKAKQPDSETAKLAMLADLAAMKAWAVHSSDDLADGMYMGSRRFPTRYEMNISVLRKHRNRMMWAAVGFLAAGFACLMVPLPDGTPWALIAVGWTLILLGFICAVKKDDAAESISRWQDAELLWAALQLSQAGSRLDVDALGGWIGLGKPNPEPSPAEEKETGEWLGEEPEPVEETPLKPAEPTPEPDKPAEPEPDKPVEPEPSQPEESE